MDVVLAFPGVSEPGQSQIVKVVHVLKGFLFFSELQLRDLQISLDFYVRTEYVPTAGRPLVHLEQVTQVSAVGRRRESGALSLDRDGGITSPSATPSSRLVNFPEISISSSSNKSRTQSWSRRTVEP